MELELERGKDGCCRQRVEGGVHWLGVPKCLFIQSLLPFYSFGTSAVGTGRLAGSRPAAFASAQIAFGTRAASGARIHPYLLRRLHSYIAHTPRVALGMVTRQDILDNAAQINCKMASKG